MAITATRSFEQPVDPTSYRCARCGHVRSTKSDRARPTLCRDCQGMEESIAADLAALEAEVQNRGVAALGLHDQRCWPDQARWAS